MKCRCQTQAIGSESWEEAHARLAQELATAVCEAADLRSEVAELVKCNGSLAALNGDLRREVIAANKACDLASGSRDAALAEVERLRREPAFELGYADGWLQGQRDAPTKQLQSTLAEARALLEQVYDVDDRYIGRKLDDDIGTWFLNNPEVKS